MQKKEETKFYDKNLETSLLGTFNGRIFWSTVEEPLEKRHYLSISTMFKDSVDSIWECSGVLIYLYITKMEMIWKRKQKRSSFQEPRKCLFRPLCQI